MDKYQQLEKRIQAIEIRNKRVELDKAWETSLFRRLFLAVLTYIAALAFLLIINAPQPYLASIVPAGAYLLQQYSLPFMKKVWGKNFKKK